MRVASEASNWASATARRTACAGTDAGRSSLLISVFVSTTTRSLAFFGKDLGQLVLGQTASGCPLGNAVAKALKLLRVQGAQAVVFVRGEQHRNVPVLTADHNRLPLRRGGKRRGAVFCVGG